MKMRVICLFSANQIAYIFRSNGFVIFIYFLYFLYLTDQTDYHPTDCYDLTNNCTYWALNKKYCRTEDYAEWMSAACKESCGFCIGM